MSLQHFFLESQVISRETNPEFVLGLSRDDLAHAKVLRLHAGEHIAVIDAEADYFECEIVSASAKEVVVSIAKRLQKQESFPRVTLVQGLCKGSKMDSVIRHATELGVCKFMPFAASRSVLKLVGSRAQTKVARWQAIAKSAAMQAGQTRIPDVLQPASVQGLCEALKNYDAVLVCWEQAQQTCALAQALAPVASARGSNVKVAVVVGPEGGITQEEIDCFLSSIPNAKLISLGRSILRTETAGIVAPALVLYQLGALC